MSGYLSQAELVSVRDAAIEIGYGAPELRQFLFDGVLRSYEAVLPRFAAPGLQVQSDLNNLNAVERLIDGSVPLEQWLHNAVAQTSIAAPRATFQTALDKVGAIAAGEPDVADSVDQAELEEEIIFLDDMVPFAFLGAGARAGSAVARITVPPYERGVPMGTDRGLPAAPPHAGTGWLISPTLLVTNHHVINARSRTNGHRPLVAPEDLACQASAATVSFDYNSEEDGAVTQATCSGLAAWDPELDYAIVRLAQDVGRSHLVVAAAALQINSHDRVAVNVIQHPSGGPKRVAIRNNLAHRATERDLNYFTDTRGGSSGSPVFTDDWVVVALHRGSQRVENVRFMGKNTAYINVGTQMASVMADLQVRFPDVYREIRASQPT